MRRGWILASVVLLAGTFCAAIDDLQYELSAVNESDPAESYKTGDDLYQQGKYDDALGCFNKAIEIDSNFVNAWNSKGNTPLRP
ncbi:tetratricopeptide repeat protein [Candidatus Methanocrinis natronophilus]|uniref:tetratricopeptide repeat protein n=1 Tax=Candidatus Methanocrinis natronophilus TaxID=3033396 RepID=UPI003742216F